LEEAVARPFNPALFSPDQLMAMGDAYNAVLTQTSGIALSDIADRVIQHASDGYRTTEELAARVLDELARSQKLRAP
jgi:hypothetical protein